MAQVAAEIIIKERTQLMSVLKNINRVYWTVVLVVFALGFAGCESDNDDGGSEIGITLTKS